MNKEAFIKKFALDKEFAAKVHALGGPEEAKAFAQAEGMSFTDEEINNFLSSLQKLKTDCVELDDEYMDLVVGGDCSDNACKCNVHDPCRGHCNCVMDNTCHSYVCSRCDD